MKKTILILEDNLNTADYLKDDVAEFFKDNFDVSIIVCNGIYEADDRIGQTTNLALVIADLNMSPQGLGDEQLVEQTVGAVLTGWVWAKNRLLEPGMEIPICFYTAFADELEKTDDYKELALHNNISIVSKGKNSTDTLCEQIKILLNL